MALKSIKITQKCLNHLVEHKKYYDLGCALVGELDESVVLPNEVEDYINSIADAYLSEDGYLADNYVELIGKFYCANIKGVN